MGECDICGKWHCECVLQFLDELVKVEAHRAEMLLEHRSLAARHDPAFQSFMKKASAP